MRVILVVDVVFLGSLLVAGFGFLANDKNAKRWILRICALLGGSAAVLWFADAVGIIHLPRPSDAPPPITGLPEHSVTHSAGSAPVIIPKVKHENVIKEHEDALKKEAPTHN